MYMGKVYGSATYFEMLQKLRSIERMVRQIALFLNLSDGHVNTFFTVFQMFSVGMKIFTIKCYKNISR